MKLGQPAVFVCETIGNPKPDVVWKREDKKEISRAKAGNLYSYFNF